MKIKQILVIFAITFCIIMSCTSCSEVAITGRNQLSLIPDSTLNTMALQEYKEFLSENKKSTDAEATAMVQRVGLRVANAVEQFCRNNGLSDRISGFSWEFNLIESKEVNAWAMPGGKVCVYTGILPVTKDETGLAVVIGHEIAHVVARHGNERMSQGLLIEMGGMALSEAVAAKPAATKNLFLQSYSIGSQVGYLLPYSRLQEKEADRMGLIFMAMAGYDPQQSVDFWQRMSSQSGSSGETPEFLSTHPADTTRINNIKSYLPEAMSYYNSPGGTTAQPTTTPAQNTNSSGSWRDIIYGPEKK